MMITLGFFVFGLCTRAFGVSQDEVNFLLYTEPNTSPQPVSNTDLSIRQSKFNSTINTKFIIHGMNAKGTDSWVTNMAQAILNREDANVFAVDWSKKARLLDVIWDFLWPGDNIRAVGVLIAQFIKKLNTIQHAKYGDFHLIGHSLGAHVAGYAGDQITGLGRITGLDPAGPLFEGKDPKDRLDPTDAVFVDAIHTDAGGLGITQTVGDVDYFPNGGETQPGCDDNGCNHERVLDLFMESIKSNCIFRSCLCNNRFNFEAGRCNTCLTAFANMGYNSKRPHDGTYYLYTNGQSPYCKG